ncbi:MAG: Uma2 family endonuclease [Clostridia bacterium]|nr:Uma2 family endonuclease [Clostridia bacterium]
MQEHEEYMNAKNKYSASDVAKMHEHAELIDGFLVIEDRTTVTHSRLVTAVAAALREYIAAKGGSCEVFTENVALFCNELTDHERDFYLPDVMAVCDPNGVDDRGVHVAPRFVAEVTSESTRRHDYGEKMLTYRNIGVEEYWVIDPQRNCVTTYLLSKQYAPEVYLYPDAVTSEVYPELKIDFRSFWKQETKSMRS